MKMYVAMTSISLLIGAGLGHLNGQYHAAADFIGGCESSHLVAFQDHERDQRRHFHCFELDLAKGKQLPVMQQPEPVPMI